jgi:hypothetical protein
MAGIEAKVQLYERLDKMYSSYNHWDRRARLETDQQVWQYGHTGKGV